MSQNRIRVLVVDDSAIVRKILSEALAASPDIEVVGTAPDPLVARKKIESLSPDVLTLDIEMPRMDGISFLREIMATRPLPVIIISSLAQRGCATALEALSAGAVEVLGKPSGPYSVGELRLELAQKVRSAASARLRPRNGAKPPAAALPPQTPAAMPAPASGWPVVAIGASTGGTEALSRILTQFPADCPPVAVVQHIPPVFSAAFAARLNQSCRPEVKEAQDGDAVLPGRVLIAPGDAHMVLRRTPRGLAVKITGGPRVCYQRPSVDVLFQSAAEVCAANSVGVILTGMGNDGAAGLLKMRHAGARTLAQDEQSCVVFGMPKEAIRCGAVEQVLPLDRIPDGIAAAVRSVGRRN